MAEQIEATPKIGDAYDEGLDLLKLPGHPWTVEKLGEETYCKLARVSGAFNPDLDPNFRPALDPRTFASGRANRRAQLFGLTLPPASVQSDLEFEAWFASLGPEQQHAIEALNSETAKIQESIDAGLPVPAGTPRGAGAKPLTPAKLTIKKRMF